MKLESLNQMPLPVVYLGDKPLRCAEGAPRQCRGCELEKSLRSALKEDCVGKPKDDRPSHACHLCDRTFASSANVQRHLNEVHVTECKFSCPLCDRKFKCADYLNRHMKNNHGQLSNCVAQKTKSDLASSEKRSKSTKKSKDVTTQNKRPSSKISSSGNVSDAVGDEESWQQRPQKKTSASSVITKAMSEGDDYYSTAEGDSSNSPLDEQPKKRSRWSDDDSKDSSKSGINGSQPVVKLMEKTAEQTEPINSRCHICNKGIFINQDDLKRHLRCHIPPKVYACDRCEEKFVSEPFYIEHLAIHAREEEELQLRRSKKVIGLIRCYTREQRPDLVADDADPRDMVAEYECCLCAVKYDQEKDLRQHVKKTHSDGDVGELFCCTLCSPAKDYEKEYNFRAHLETVHEGREKCEHVCPHSHCSSGFRYKVNLQFHLKYDHASMDEANGQ